MKINIPINYLLFGLLIVVVVIGILRTGRTAGTRTGKQGISTTGASTEKLKEIKVVAKRFSFSPNPITLKLNETVRFRLSSEDVAHGFSVPELGIDQTIEPGKETVFEFTPTAKGKFLLMCSLECGTGHTGMRGTIVVE